MRQRTVWNYFEIDAAEGGEFIVVHRRSIEQAKGGTLTIQTGSTKEVGRYACEADARAEARLRNEALGSDHVPPPA